MTFYNTASEKGSSLKKANQAASNQELKVLSLFKLRPDDEFSPSDVWLYFDSRLTPLTSIRRAICNLTSKGKLVKTGNMAKGIYGRNEHTWKLAEG